MYKNVVGKPEVKRRLGRYKLTCDDNTKTGLRSAIEGYGLDSFDLRSSSMETNLLLLYKARIFFCDLGKS
jgi:hypothetical protein